MRLGTSSLSSGHRSRRPPPLLWEGGRSLTHRTRPQGGSNGPCLSSNPSGTAEGPIFTTVPSDSFRAFFSLPRLGVGGS